MELNGRVNILDSTTNTVFTLQDKIPVRETTSYRDAMKGNFTDSKLSTTFFSAQNIKILQNAIKAGVYKKSNGQYNIGPQNEEQLKIIMRSTYLTYSKNMPNKIREQVHELNNLVLEYSINQVYGEAQGYTRYLYDASTLPVPIDRPIHIQTNKTLEFKGWF